MDIIHLDAVLPISARVLAQHESGAYVRALRGTVIEVRAGRAQISLPGGGRVTAEARVPLLPGQEVLVRLPAETAPAGQTAPGSAITRENPLVRLFAAAENPGSREFSLFASEIAALSIRLAMQSSLPMRHAGFTEELGRIAALLQGLLEKPLTGSDGKTRLKETVRDSGVFLEARLLAGEKPESDRKATLLRLDRLLGRLESLFGQEESPEGKKGGLPSSISKLRVETGRLLGEITSRQALFLARTDTGERPEEIPVPLYGEFRGSRLVIFRDRSPEKENRLKREARVALHLDMERLGKVGVQAVLRGGRISVSLEVTNEEICDFLNNSVPELERRISPESGTTDVFLRCTANPALSDRPREGAGIYRRKG